MARKKSKKFIPPGDSDFALMGKIFARNIAKDPARFHLSPAIAEAIGISVVAFRDALCVATRIATRTKLSIMLKDDARYKAERIVRKYSKIIRANEEISAIDKMLIGVTERPTKLRKSVLPDTPPLLRYIGCSDASAGPGGYHILKYSELYVEKLHTKPHGEWHVELFVELVAEGEPIPEHPGELSGGRPWYLRSFKGNPIKVEFPIPAKPALVVYWARWADNSGNFGEFSKTAEARIEGAHGTRMLNAAATRKLTAEPRRITAIHSRDGRYLEQCQPQPLLIDDRAAQEMGRMLVDETGMRAVRMLVDENVGAGL